jgi:hypothetical protein
MTHDVGAQGDVRDADATRFACVPLGFSRRG